VLTLGPCPDGSDGFTKLWQAGRLGMTTEACALRPWFADLFTDEDRDKADASRFRRPWDLPLASAPQQSGACWHHRGRQSALDRNQSARRSVEPGATKPCRVIKRHQRLDKKSFIAVSIASAARRWKRVEVNRLASVWLRMFPHSMST
jgi:hypothetical protein